MTNRSHQSLFSQAQDLAKRSHAEYVQGESLVEMVHEDLIASRISVDDCRDIIQYLRDQDAPTRHGLEDILAIKGERAGDVANRVARMAAVRIVADIEKKNARIRSA